MTAVVGIGLGAAVLAAWVAIIGALGGEHGWQRLTWPIRSDFQDRGR
jgi:hypothetical protein